MSILVGPFTIANGQSLSGVVDVRDNWSPANREIDNALAGVTGEMSPCQLLCPSEVTSASIQLEHSYDGTVWYVVSPLAVADAIAIADDDSNLVRKSIPLDPARYLGIGQNLRLRTSGNEGQESVFYMVFRKVA